MREEATVDISEDIKKYDFYIKNIDKSPVNYLKGITISDNIDFHIITKALDKISVNLENKSILELIKSKNKDIINVVKLISEGKNKEAKILIKKSKIIDSGISY
jgi:hypothetical protein